MRVEDLMSHPVVTCSPGDSLDQAARQMWEHDCGVVPVTGEDGQLVGMVTDRDICMATLMRGSAPSAIRVGDTMAKEVFCCHEGDSIERAEQLMSEKQVRRVPVVDERGRAKGVLSLNDIARHAAGRKANAAERKQLSATLAAIGEAREIGADKTADTIAIHA